MDGDDASVIEWEFEYLFEDEGSDEDGSEYEVEFVLGIVQ